MVLTSQGMNTIKATVPLMVELILQAYLWGLEALEIQSPPGRQHPSLLGGQAFLEFQGNLGHLLWERPVISMRKT